MKRLSKMLLLPALLAGAAPALAQNEADGLWLNPRGTVAVKTGDCNGKLCGWVVWASPEAKADAKESGLDRLDGVELLEDYVREDGHHWSGSVYVPDMGHHFASTITQLGPTALKVQGCLIGGFICKAQVWQRIEKLPNA